MKYRVLSIILVLILFTSSLGLAYSYFKSDVNMSGNKNVAKFIFNTENLSEIQLSLIGLQPGDVKEYPFAVSNSNEIGKSEVTLEYQMTLKTYHFIPLIIELYSVIDEEKSLILTCDETMERNEKNELVCETAVQEIKYTLNELDNYILKIEFPEIYNDPIYSKLVDFINIEIKSWQKIGD